MQLSPSLARMRDALSRAQDGALAIERMVTALRSEHDLLQTLPPPYAEALEEILARLESASLFSDESCSFSQRDLLDALAIWLERAAQAGAGAKTG